MALVDDERAQRIRRSAVAARQRREPIDENRPNWKHAVIEQRIRHTGSGHGDPCPPAPLQALVRDDRLRRQQRAERSEIR